VTTDEGVNLKVALPRGDSPAARDRLVEVMQAGPHRRWDKPKSRRRYEHAVAVMTAGLSTRYSLHARMTALIISLSIATTWCHS
jgi:hypothetical protein